MTALLADAKCNRPDLLAAEAAVGQTQAQLNATKASILPTLSLTSNIVPGGVFAATNEYQFDDWAQLVYPIVYWLFLHL